MSADVIQLGAAREARQEQKNDQNDREESYRAGGCLTTAEFRAVYEAASPERKAFLAAAVFAASQKQPSGRTQLRRKDPFFKQVDRIQKARPDLGWSGAVTAAHDIKRGLLTFDKVVTGKPATPEIMRPVLAAHETLKNAEALFDEAVAYAAGLCGRSPKSIRAMAHHARRGHRLNGST